MSKQQSYKAHVGAVLGLGLPLVGSHLAQFAVQVLDTVMLGWYDVQALAAVVLAGGMFFLFFIFGSGFGWAVMPIVASAAQQGDDATVRRATRMALWLSMLFALAVLPIMLLGESILVALGQTREIAALAGDYLRIAAFSLFPALGVMVLKSYLAALERTQIVLWATVAAAVLNGFLNYILIFGAFGAPELGITGAALASFVVQMLNFIVLVVYAARVEPQHALMQRIWRLDSEAFRRVFVLGWPIGVTSLAEVGLFNAAAILVGWIGTVELAAHGIGLQISGAAFLMHVGLSNVATIRAGQAVGRGDTDGLRRGAIAVTGVSFAVVLVAISAFLIIPDVLIGLFLDPGDPARDAVIAVGVGLLAVAALFQLADAGQVIALGLLRGVQDTRMPMIYAALSYWAFGMPASYLLGFPLGLGVYGVWLGLTLGLALAWVMMGWRFWSRLGRA